MMVALTPEKIAELKAGSQEAAAAFIEDIPHVREIVTKESPSRAEIRRLSGILRRLLVERDIAAVSDPRLGKVKLIGPDNASAYKAEKKRPFLFYLTGGGKVLGWSGSIYALEAQRQFFPFSNTVVMPEIAHGTTMEMRLDTFLNQRVICYRGEWASRNDVITYVANVASGVHSGTPKPSHPKHELLARARCAAYLKKQPDGTLHLELFPRGIDFDESSFKYSPEAFDLVFVELVSAAAFLVQSPFVAELEKLVRSELGLAP